MSKIKSKILEYIYRYSKYEPSGIYVKTTKKIYNYWMWSQMLGYSFLIVALIFDSSFLGILALLLIIPGIVYYVLKIWIQIFLDE